MTKKEIVKEIKLLFGMVDETVIETKFREYILKDGTKLICEGEELQIGGKVFVLDGENQIPAPDGEHEILLEEKSLLVITKDGLVTDIKEVEITPSEVKEDENLKAEEAGRIKMEYSELTSIISELEERLNSKIESNFKTLKDATILLAENFEALPGGTKIEVEKSGLIPEVKKSLTKDEKFIELLKSIKNK